MSNELARQRILARLRQRPTPGARSVDVGAWVEAAMEDPVATFISAHRGHHAEVIETRADALDRVLVDTLRTNAWQRCLTDAHYRETLSKSDAPLTLPTFDGAIEDWKSALFHHIDVVISAADAAIADTGSLVLNSHQNAPRSWSLVPPAHIVVLHASRIVPRFSDVLNAWKDDTRWPANRLLISGPSKTADIQRTLAYGAHGPKRLITIIVSEQKE